MFDLVEVTENYDSLDLATIQQNNVDCRARCEELEIEIMTLAGQMNAVQYCFIKLLAEFDDNGGWQGNGVNSFAHWLNWKIGRAA
ncbi:MAG: hypothetical protein IIB71_06440 [Proteobacteria bacterium]|nr:hypothetical protein [Pseudomonadota bacterium]